MSQPLPNVPVLIAGGGPVGVTLAIDLATRGIRSTVLEARGELPPNPRCNTTNARSMEFLRRLGCADAVREAGLPADHNTDVVYQVTMLGEEIQRFVRPTPAQIRRGEAHGIGADWPTPEPQHFISQLYMEPVLRRHAVSRHGVDLRLGWELLSFEQDDDGVDALVRDMGTGQTQTVRASYLVGADGGASRVRRDIGARLEGVPRIGDACSVYLRSPFMATLQARAPGWMYRLLGGVVVVAINGHDEWLFHTHPADGEALDSFDPMPQIFEAVGQPFEYETLNVTRWTARAMVANKYREGRVLLAGDAAHIWIPMGGFGMNSGIGDAISLGWRLAGVMQGWLAPQHLDSYGSERASLGERVASQAERWGRELRPLMRPGAADKARLLASAAARAELAERLREVNRSEWESVGMMLGYTYEDSPVIAHDGTPPPPFELSTYHETSWPGARAPHLWRDGRPGVSLHDDFGLGFTLLRIASDAAAPRGQALIDAMAAAGVPLTVLDVPEAEALRKYEGYALVLVRPDQHIAWRAKTEPQDAAAVVERLTGRLMPVPAPAATSTAEPLAAEGLAGPAAIALSPDGRRLVLAEAGGARRLLQCRVEADGQLSVLRPFVPLKALGGGLGAQGLAMNSDGSVWACLPMAGAVHRYDATGRLTARVLTPAGHPTACALSADQRTLFIAGIAPLPEGASLADALGRGETAGWLARAAVENAVPAK